MRLLVTEKVPNIMLFIPLGFFLPIVFSKLRSWGQTLKLALATTCCIEFIQFFIGRSADIDDIITNFLGAVIGFGLFKLAEKILQHTAFWHRLLNN